MVGAEANRAEQVVSHPARQRCLIFWASATALVTSRWLRSLADHFIDRVHRRHRHAGGHASTIAGGNARRGVASLHEKKAGAHFFWRRHARAGLSRKPLASVIGGDTQYCPSHRDDHDRLSTQRRLTCCLDGSKVRRSNQETPMDGVVHSTPGGLCPWSFQPRCSRYA